MKKTAIIRVLCVVAVSIIVGQVCPAQTSSPSPKTWHKGETLEQRIAQRDTSAFVEAADAHRKDLIPLIEKVSDSKVGKMALAKLGVRKYLDEIVTELTTSISVAVTSGGETHVHLNYAALAVQIAAFKKLAYIKDRSTVKLIAGFLYGKENADDYFVKSDSDSSGYWDYMLIYERPSEATMKTLAQIVDNPPQSDDVKVWQQWWEKNKDKYP